jgi:acyl carrier protein
VLGVANEGQAWHTLVRSMGDEQLRSDLKTLIIDTLRPEAVTAKDIGDEQPLFASDSAFGFDSIHALELLTAIEYRFNVRFPNDGTAKSHFRSVASLAAFVRQATTAG